MAERDQRATVRVEMTIWALLKSRVPVDSPHAFNGKAFLIDLSYDGCQVLAPISFPVGTVLELFASTSGTPTIRTVEASVIWSRSVPSQSTVSRWKVGLRYGIPGNHWQIHPPPQSWIRVAQEQLV